MADEPSTVESLPGAGRTALILVQLLITQLSHDGIIEVERLERALRLLLEEISDERREDVSDALALLGTVHR